MKFQFHSKRYKIKFFFLIEEASKMFAYFLYNLHHLFYLKVLEIPFSNSRLFPHADNPLLQETPSKFVEYRSGVDVGGHVELHLPVTRVAIVIHHAAQVFIRAKGLSLALSHCLNVVVKV